MDSLLDHELGRDEVRVATVRDEDHPFVLETVPVGVGSIEWVAN